MPNQQDLVFTFGRPIIFTEVVQFGKNAKAHGRWNEINRPIGKNMVGASRVEVVNTVGWLWGAWAEEPFQTGLIYLPDGGIVF